MASNLPPGVTNSMIDPPEVPMEDPHELSAAIAKLRESLFDDAVFDESIIKLSFPQSYADTLCARLNRITRELEELERSAKYAADKEIERRKLSAYDRMVKENEVLRKALIDIVEDCGPPVRLANEALSKADQFNP